MKVLRNLKLAILMVAAVIAFTVGWANIALAVVEFDQDVTPDAIFGSGNANGGFTTDRQNGIELGIRAKIPFAGILNSNGDGTYSYTLAETDHDSNAGTAQRWNFDWTVNTDYLDSSGVRIDELTYLLGIDFDPSPATNFLVFDPITPNTPPLNTPVFDHSIGDNTTGNGDGVETADPGIYATRIADNNVLQQSWRHSFFPFHPTLTYDPTIDGTYAIYLLAKDSDGKVVAKVNIQVLIGNAKPAPDHFQCYKVKKQTKLNPKPIVDLDDQFVWRENVKVDKKAYSYCTPVDKNNEGITNRNNNLTCYKVKGFEPDVEVTVENQFGEQSFELEKSRLLCVPSVQIDIQETDKKDDDDDDDD
jgi:hypothetical protein